MSYPSRRSFPRALRIVTGVGLLLALVGGTAAQPGVVPIAAAVLRVVPTSTPRATPLATLATLPVTGAAPMTGYARTAQFGPAWLDVDRNGCDTRDDILSRDLTAITRAGRCRVLSGTMTSPYTGRIIHFVRGNRTSTLVQIDHVVSLGDAWRTGAQRLTQAKRVALANDPANLFAVDGRSNEQKGDGDAATWLPAAKSFRCQYVGHQVSVKAKYGLWVTAAEHDAMLRVLSNCSAVPVSTMPASNAPSPPASAAPAGCDHAYSGQCVPVTSDVDCAGRGGNGPSYLTGTVTVIGPDHYGLDRDHDGIGCN